MSQKSIILFPDVEILPKLSKAHIIEYLKRYCIIDELDDSIYIKKLGNDKTTFAVDFEFDQVTLVRKVKDKKGHNTDEIIFRDYDANPYHDDCCNYITDKHNREINS